MKKKTLILFTMLLVSLLVISGCSSDGGNGLPSADDDPYIPDDSTTLSLNIEEPIEASSAGALNNSESEMEYEFVVKDFNNDQEIDVIVNRTDNGYEVSGVLSGKNLEIIVLNEEIRLATYIPEAGTVEVNEDINTATTVLHKIVSDLKNEVGEVTLTREDIHDTENGLLNDARNIAANLGKSDFKNEIVDDVIPEKVKERVSERINYNKSDTAKAKEMVNFVRNTAFFVEDSAEVPAATIDKAGSEISTLINDFNEETDGYFALGFLALEPGNYGIESLKANEELRLFFEDMTSEEIEEYLNSESWSWTFEDTTNTKIVEIEIKLPGELLTIDEDAKKTTIDLVKYFEEGFYYSIKDTEATRLIFDGKYEFEVLNLADRKEIQVDPDANVFVEYPQYINTEARISGEYTSVELKPSSMELVFNDELNLNKLNETAINFELLTNIDAQIYLADILEYQGNFDFEILADNSENTEEVNLNLSLNNSTLQTLFAEDNITLDISKFDYGFNLNEQREKNTVEFEGSIKDDYATWNGYLSGEVIITEEQEDYDMKFIGSLDHSSYANAYLDLSFTSVYFDDYENWNYEDKLVINDLSRGNKYINGSVKYNDSYGNEGYKESEIINLVNENNFKFIINYDNDELNNDESGIFNESDEKVAGFEEGIDGGISILYDGGDIETIF